MGKEFIEYQSDTQTIPYRASTLCFCLTGYLKDYITTKRKLTANIHPDIRDAVLVDAINYLGCHGGIDYALYTRDLYDRRKEEDYVDPQCILTVLPNHFATYIFDEGIVESVLRNRHMNNVTKEFDVNDGVTLIVDFINYISEVNGYDRVFTVKELYEREQKSSHERDMKKLKKFLELSDKYSQRLANGENINSIFYEMAKQHDLKYISEREVYYYTDKIKERVGQKEMFSWDRYDVEKEIYAMAYAYAKQENKIKEQPQIKIIRKKISEMKKDNQKRI